MEQITRFGVCCQRAIITGRTYMRNAILVAVD
jgi:hypothetical protein